jgi:hypothetical protein
MAVHQCPFCPLRFSFRTEVQWHIENEHRSVKVTEREPDVDDAPPADGADTDHSAPSPTRST